MTDLTLAIDHHVARQVYCGIGDMLKTKLGTETPLPHNLERLMQALVLADSPAAG